MPSSAGAAAGVGAGLLLLAPPLVEWVRRRPGIDPVRWLLASIADDAAYGAGVWAGCVRSRSVGPLFPTFVSEVRRSGLRGLAVGLDFDDLDSVGTGTGSTRTGDPEIGPFSGTLVGSMTTRSAHRWLPVGAD